MNRTLGWLIAALVVGGGIGVFYYYWNNPGPPPAALEQPEASADNTLEPQEQGIRHPIPGREGDPNAGPQLLPELNLSDQPVRRALGEVFGESIVARFLVPERIVRRIVVTVDNLPREKLVVQMRPIKPLGGETLVVGDANELETVTLSPDNYARYKPVIELVRLTNAEQLSTLYFRLYPLFQQAYEELGYPGKYFNDRLVETIDHLLQTPEPAGEIRLVRPKVFYEYADPELERLSAGQKLLIRMGPGNAAAVKQKLEALRAAVTEGPPAQ